MQLKISAAYMILLSTQLLVSTAHAQTAADEVKKLKEQLAEAVERAEKAELEAKLYKEEAIRMRYIAIAHFLAENSVELKDQQLQGLLALQALNFQRDYKGNFHDKTIGNGLIQALIKLSGQPDIKNANSLAKDHESIANELQKYIIRNLSKEEWRIFVAEDLPYEKTIKSLPENY